MMFGVKIYQKMEKKKIAKRYIKERDDSDEEGEISLMELAKRLNLKMRHKWEMRQTQSENQN